MMSIAIGFFVTTYYLKFYGETAVAAFGVGTTNRADRPAPVRSDLSAAIVSIVGQNNGAEASSTAFGKTVRLCLSDTVIYLIILAASVLLFVFAGPLLVRTLFTDDRGGSTCLGEPSTFES